MWPKIYKFRDGLRFFVLTRLMRGKLYVILRANHLKEIEVLFESTAALYSTPDELPPGKQLLLERLLARLDGVLQAAESKYVMLHAPRAALAEITALLPGGAPAGGQTSARKRMTP